MQSNHSLILSFVLALIVLAACSSDQDDVPQVTAVPETERVASIQSTYEVTSPVLSLPVAEVGPYPLGEPRLSYFQQFNRNEQGIILTGATESENDVGVIAKFILAVYRDFLKTGNTLQIDDALAHGQWLVDSQKCENDIGYWLFYGPTDSIVIVESPLKSAMINGLALAALTQMVGFADNKEDYLSAIECGLKAFLHDMDYGGVSSLTDQYHWFEEYAVLSRAKILNGGIFALAGVWMTAEYLDSSLGNFLFNEKVKTLVERIKRYDAVHTSKYHDIQLQGEFETFGRPVHNSYNLIHVLQLQWLYSETGEEVFFNTAERFLKYESREITDIMVSGRTADKLTDKFRYYESESFSADDKAQISLIPDNSLEEIHLYYVGHYKALPNLIVTNSSGKAFNLSPSEINYMQDGKHHTTIANYIVEPEMGIENYFEIELASGGSADIKGFRQIEVLTNDDGKYFRRLFRRWGEPNNWKTDHPLTH